MKKKYVVLSALIVCMSILAPLFSCAWDYDTLKMERRKFPGTLELITGKFLRHSKEFYEWRIKDRLEKLAKDSSKLNYYDDLAVAYDKTGQHQKAIETMLKKEQLKPGLYETKANLGTFYIHSGQLKKGVEFIDQAIKINPDAHFGREVYQKHLVNYVLSKQVDGKTILPLNKEEIGEGRRMNRSSGFEKYILDHYKINRFSEKAKKRMKATLKGLLGMMRFGKYDSPVLLEALGDILHFGKSEQDAKRLATFAFLKASYSVENKELKAQYIALSKSSIQGMEIRDDDIGRTLMPNGVDDHEVNDLIIKMLKKRLSEDLKEADKWFAKIRIDEVWWIKEGGDVDEKFDEKYYEDPSLMPLPFNFDLKFEIIPTLIFIVVFLSVLTFIIKKIQKKRYSKFERKIK